MLLVIGVLLVLGLALAQRVQRRAERLREAGIYPVQGLETEADIDRLLGLGHKIEAIKVYRALHRVGLKEAKEAVEERQRELKSRKG